MRLTVRDTKEEVGNYVSPLTTPYPPQLLFCRSCGELQLTCQIAEYIVKRINSFKASKEKPHFVLGLPTGSSPLPVYKRIVKLHEEGKVSFKVSPPSNALPR
jgi:glucosamine-6-phosphate deaminase